MSRDTTVIAVRQPDAIDDPLTELAREGARRMLAQVLIAEADAFVETAQASASSLSAAFNLSAAWVAISSSEESLGMAAIAVRGIIASRTRVSENSKTLGIRRCSAAHRCPLSREMSTSRRSSSSV